jgi:hypothetical protein
LIIALHFFSYGGNRPPKDARCSSGAAESPRPEVVVLRIYGDYLITAPFDRPGHTFEKKLYLLKISEMATVPLTYEEIGPLKVKPDGGPQGSQASP